MKPPFIKISGYDSKWSDKKNCFVPGCKPYDTDFYKEMEGIRDGRYKELITKLRSITEEKEKKEFKASKLPSLTISSVTHTWRQLSNVVNHTGLLNIDIDGHGNEHISDWPAIRDLLFEIPQVVCAFLSAGGNGVTFVVKIHPDVHEDTFLSVIDILQQKYGINADAPLKDVVRLRFVSYDPGCKIKYNFDEIPTTIPTESYLIKKAESRKTTINVYSVSEADSVLNYKNAITIAESEKEFKTKKRGAMFFQDGEKHKFLVSVAGYCNTTGMSEDFCKKMTIKFYRDKTLISDHDLFSPIESTYKKYIHQHGVKPPEKKQTAPFKSIKFLLLYISKPLLKQTFQYYNKEFIKGESDKIVFVPNKILVYLMWLISPEYTWTCIEGVYDHNFSIEECKDLIPKDCILDSANGSRVWVNKFDNFPSNW